MDLDLLLDIRAERTTRMRRNLDSYLLVIDCVVYSDKRGQFRLVERLNFVISDYFPNENGGVVVSIFKLGWIK